MAAIARAPEIGEGFHAVGVDAVSSAPEAQLRTYESEMKLWAEAARLSNFRP